MRKNMMEEISKTGIPQYMPVIFWSFFYDGVVRIPICLRRAASSKITEAYSSIVSQPNTRAS